MAPDAVAPALTALASEEGRLNGEYIVTGGAGCAGRPWWNGTPSSYRTVLASARTSSKPVGPERTWHAEGVRVAADAFADLMEGA